MIEFKTPIFLLLLPLVLLALAILHRRRPRQAFVFSSLEITHAGTSTWKMQFSFVPFLLRVAALMLVCIALAGPRKVLQETLVRTEGIDIVLALDCSGSMAAEDFEINGKRLNRFEVIKKVVGEFIDERKNDQLSIVAFAGRAYTVCPLTTDHRWLVQNLQRMRLGLIEDGTAIGSGIATSLSRFKNSTAKSKIVVLLTDGVNNAGSIDPLTSARTAAAMGVKIYTIGAGAKGYAPFPMQTVFGQTFYQNIPTDLDEDSLTKIAELTHGRFFRATDTESLRQIYQSIDRLEKSKIEQKGYKQYEEMFGWFIIAALVLLGLEWILVNTVFLKIP